MLALTLNVYETPPFNPVKVIGLEPVAVAPPGVAVAVCPVIALPPLSLSEKVTWILPFTCVAVPIVGAEGTDMGRSEAIDRTVKPPEETQLPTSVELPAGEIAPFESNTPIEFVSKLLEDARRVVPVPPVNVTPALFEPTMKSKVQALFVSVVTVPDSVDTCVFNGGSPACE